MNNILVIARMVLYSGLALASPGTWTLGLQYID